MKKLSEHINYANNKVHYSDRKIKIIVDLGSKKSVSNDEYYPRQNGIDNSILTIFFYTPEKYVSHYKKTQLQGK